MAAEHLVEFSVTGRTPATCFLASLSDGRTVIEDNRAEQPHSWFRLQAFLKENPGLKITCLRLQAADGRMFVMPSNQPGYVFGFKGHAVPPNVAHHWQGIGYFDGQKAIINWHLLPYLSHTELEVQHAEQCGFKLIRNPA